ncbi:hypothetical protein EDB81DRAFT_784954 [Dactylonectria macrodidyma]|uniref:Uncharacterized protein n=1 Tax=Dactylonectria macrodidyma TaxID=307937 RepID=A0A9P9FIE6_9HYPO|nr:hypothetical protein EDB81DRAFT_784954 [Dactylonectria macrodidyma]
MNITHILVFMLLVRIATCIILIHKGETGNTDGRIELASYGSALVLKPLAFVVAAFSVREAIDSNINGKVLYYLVVSFRSLVFLIAVLVIARAVQVKYRVRFNERTSKVSTLLLVSSIIWLLPTTYKVVAIATFQSLNRPRFRLYFHILEVVFAVWPTFATLCIILTTHAKKHNGLSFEIQPFGIVSPPTQQIHLAGNYDAPQYVCQYRGPVGLGAAQPITSGRPAH